MAIGIIYEDNNQYEKALKYMQKAVALDDNNADYLYNLGDLQYQNKFYDEAIDNYAKVIEISPLNPEIWLDYTEAIAIRNGIEKAIEAINKGIESQAENASLLYRKSSYLFESGNIKESYKILIDALEMNFSSHEELFYYKPELKENPTILEIINSYKQKNNN